MYTYIFEHEHALTYFRHYYGNTIPCVTTHGFQSNYGHHFSELTRWCLKKEDFNYTEREIRVL